MSPSKTATLKSVTDYPQIGILYLTNPIQCFGKSPSHGGMRKELKMKS